MTAFAIKIFLAVVAATRKYARQQKFEEVKNMITIDMWYNDKKEQTTGLDIQFNDLGCFYSGNIRIFGKIVGDYYADSVQEICEAFPHLEKKINACLN